MGEKAGGWGGKGSQCHYLMARFPGVAEGLHGIFAAAPEQDDARHGGFPQRKEGSCYPEWGAMAKRGSEMRG
ncbi:hypothetical protein KAM339_030250 [Aeromonas caviae]|nr:hypothetical protein KAM339_030250 [Aeromonas caviae]